MYLSHAQRASARSAGRAGVLASGVTAAAIVTAALSHADTGTFDFQAPVFDPDSGLFSYVLPDYAADGSWTPVLYDNQPLLAIVGPIEQRYIDMDLSTAQYPDAASWDRISFGGVTFDQFESHLIVDGTEYPQFVGVIDRLTFDVGGYTLGGYEYDSAHSILNFIGLGGADMGSIPLDLDYGSSISDALASSASAGVINPLDFGDLLTLS